MGLVRATKGSSVPAASRESRARGGGTPWAGCRRLLPSLIVAALQATHPACLRAEAELDRRNPNALEARLIPWSREGAVASTRSDGSSESPARESGGTREVESEIFEWRWLLEPRLAAWSCLSGPTIPSGPVGLPGYVGTPNDPLARIDLPASEEARRTIGIGVEYRDSPPEVECRGSLSVDHRFRYGDSSRTSSVSSRLQARAQVQESQANPWSLEFSGTAPWEALESPEGAPETEAPNQGIESVSLTRTFEDRVRLRLGRFVPAEVSGIGRVDACQGEVRAGAIFRAGVIVGIRPDPEEADVSTERPIAAAYLSTALGKAGTFRYSGSLGFLTTVYDGRPDRLACVFSQTACLGSRLELSSSTEVDLPTESRTPGTLGVQVTGVRVEARAPLTSVLSLRAGIDHRKHPDTRETRATVGSGNEALFQEGSWRRWVGCSQNLPGKLRLDEEVSLDTNPAVDELEKRWAISLTRTGLPWVPTARIRASFHSTDGLSPGRLGGRIGGELSCLGDRLSFQPSIGLARTAVESGLGGVAVTDVALHAVWQPGDSWNVTASGGWVFGDRPDVALVQVGLRYWF